MKKSPVQKYKLPEVKHTKASKLAHERLEHRMKLPVILDDCSNEAEARLKAVAEEVDLKKVGVDSTYKPDYLNLESYNMLRRFTIAEALIDCVAMTEATLSLRWILPDLDLVTSNYQTIKKRDWTFPTDTWYEPTWTVDHEDKRRYIHKEVLLRTDYYSQANRKVYLFIAIQFPQKPVCTSLDFCRSDVKIIEVISTQNMQPGTVYTLTRPILYKRSDELKVMAGIPPDAYGKRDQIIFHGMVAEALGGSQTG